MVKKQQRCKEGMKKMKDEKIQRVLFSVSLRFMVSSCSMPSQEDELLQNKSDVYDIFLYNFEQISNRFFDLHTQNGMAWRGMVWCSMVCHDKNVQHRQLRAPNIHSAAVFVWTISLYPLELARYTHIPLFKNRYEMGERKTERTRKTTVKEMWKEVRLLSTTRPKK